MSENVEQYINNLPNSNYLPMPCHLEFAIVAWMCLINNPKPLKYTGKRLTILMNYHQATVYGRIGGSAWQQYECT